MSRIRGYEEPFMNHVVSGEFSVDNTGRIWKHRDARGNPYNPPVRAERQPNPNGYLQVRFWNNGVRVNAGANRIVYRALKGAIPADFEVNHENGIKDDNRPDNLTAMSRSENKKHADRNGLRDQSGQKNPAHKLTDGQVAQIRLAYSKGGFTMLQLAGRFGVSFQNISDIVRGRIRVKQGGPIQPHDLRHSVSPRDPVTGRFTPPTISKTAEVAL